MNFALQKTFFGFFVMVYDRMGDDHKFLYENFSRGRPRFQSLKK